MSKQIENRCYPPTLIITLGRVDEESGKKLFNLVDIPPTLKSPSQNHEGLNHGLYAIIAHRVTQINSKFGRIRTYRVQHRALGITIYWLKMILIRIDGSCLTTLLLKSFLKI